MFPREILDYLEGNWSAFTGSSDINIRNGHITYLQIIWIDLSFEVI
jgi:hypothetical protein